MKGNNEHKCGLLKCWAEFVSIHEPQEKPQENCTGGMNTIPKDILSINVLLIVQQG